MPKDSYGRGPNDMGFDPGDDGISQFVGCLLTPLNIIANIVEGFFHLLGL